MPARFPPKPKYVLDVVLATCARSEKKGLLTFFKRVLAKAILLITVITVVPVVALFLLDRLSGDLFLGLQIGFFFTLPPGFALAAAYVLAKDYAARGQQKVLTFGGAVFSWALTYIAVIVFIFVSPTLNPGWAVVTIGILLSSVFHFSGVFPGVEQPTTKVSRKSRLALTYALITIATGVLSYAAFEGATLSLFYIGGGTLLDVSFTSGSIILFSMSSVLFFRRARVSGEAPFYHLYSFGLALFALATIPSLWGQSGVSEAGFLNSTAILGACMCFFIAALLHLEGSSDCTHDKVVGQTGGSST